jgi:hypothetical protein
MKKTIYVFDNRANRQLAKKYARSKKFRGTTVILMSIPVPIHAVIAALDLPKGNANRGARAQEVTNACEVSTYVTVSPATITTIKGDITNYDNSTPATRTSLWRIVHNDLKGLMSLFQGAADADPANAIAIIESGKFKVKKISIVQKHEFEAENNPVSGVIDLRAQGGPARSCHDWMYSADGTKFERMYPTVNAETQKIDLTPLTWAYFTHELITKDGPQGLSQVIKILVK